MIKLVLILKLISSTIRALVIKLTVALCLAAKKVCPSIEDGAWCLVLLLSLLVHLEVSLSLHLHSLRVQVDYDNKVTD